MKLSYRGVKYQNESSPLEVTEGEIGGTYRGQNWKFHYVRHIPEPPAVQNLRYRGVAYRTGEPEVAVSTAVAHPAAGLPRQTLPTRHKIEREKILDQAMRTHLANIRSSLEHRMQVARAKGDENLIRLLEAESAQMAHPLQ